MVYKRAYGNSVLSVSSFFLNERLFFRWRETWISYLVMRNDKSIPPAFTKESLGIDAIEDKVCSESDREKERIFMEQHSNKSPQSRYLVKISLPHHLLQQITHLSLLHKLVVAVAAQ